MLQFGSRRSICRAAARRLGSSPFISPTPASSPERLLEIFPAEAVTTAPEASAKSTSTKDLPPRSQRSHSRRSWAQVHRGVDRFGTSSRTSVRTRSIIIATERAYLRILEMIRQLDVPLEGEGRIHVHYVQHGAATDIAAALSALDRRLWRSAADARKRGSSNRGAAAGCSSRSSGHDEIALRRRDRQ